MENTSRVKLYRWTLQLLTQNDSFKYKGILSDLILNFDGFVSLLNANISLLDGVEDYFLVNEDTTEVNRDNDIRAIIENRSSLLSNYLRDKELEKFLTDLLKSTSNDLAFNRLLNTLNSISNKELSKGIGILPLEKMPEMKQVFLSYAYVDKLYTICLFLLMLHNGILLYVDWIFCDELNDGRDIKKNLSKELNKSEQLLFFRTVNSELHIKGNLDIRGWCAWELGSFYHMDENNNEEKYYLELYDNKKAFNRQLDGIKKLKGIVGGRLI